jgi:hypothetical protein
MPSNPTPGCFGAPMNNGTERAPNIEILDIPDNAFPCRTQTPIQS